MNNSDDKICLYCDYGNVDIMRENGYTDYSHVFCECSAEIMPATHTCQFFQATDIEEKKMNILISRMADDLESKGFR